MIYLERVRNNLLNPDSKLTVVDGGGGHAFDSSTLAQYIGEYIHCISKLNIGRGQREVALLAERTPECICFMYALMFSGYTPFLVDVSCDRDVLSKIITPATNIFGSRKKKNKSDILIQDIPKVHPNKESVRFLREVCLDGDTPLLSVHTSGTTGVPKKVAYSDKNISWAVDEYSRVYNFSQKDSILFSLPFHYCYSVIPCCIVPFALGKKVILAPSDSTPIDIARLIEKEKVHILVVNPVFYIALSRLDLCQFDLSSLQLCDSGGESIPPSVVDMLYKQANTLITEGYGLTETTSLTHFLLPDSRGQIRIGSVGRACSDVKTRLLDTLGDEVENGEIGELWVSGPMVADGVETELMDGENWLNTEDLFYEDSDGFFYFVSRKKDAPIEDSEFVFVAFQAVQKLVNLDNIKDVTHVVNGPGDITIFVSLIDSMSARDRETYGKHIQDLLPISIRDSATIRYVDRIPRTVTGKVKKGDL